MRGFPSTLIDAISLRALLDAGSPVRLFDCSFDLGKPDAGRQAYAQSHLPGARHLHLDDDLSGAKSPVGARDGGRHPLPTLSEMARRAGAWGITPDTPVVVYDNQGASFAARAWWLLRWIGHTQVAVLDGGVAAWQQAGGAVSAGDEAAASAAPPYPVGAPAMPTIDGDQLLRELGRWTIVDARAGERYRGDVEPLDARAGHIPGARSRFFKDNLGADGAFLPVPQLRTAFERHGVLPAQIVHQCGSGVTACHNILAMEHAGLAGSTLYPGSWSEWSAHSDRPVAVGGG